MEAPPASPTSPGPPPENPPAAPSDPQRVDAVGSAIWIALGMAILVAALNLDRLENRGGTLYNAPGLVPGLLGIAIAAMGAILGVRAWRRRAAGRGGAGSAGASRRVGAARGLAVETAAPFADSTHHGDSRTLAIGAALCLTYAVGLVGRGIPFWLATFLFVSAYVLVAEWQQRGAAGQRIRGMLLALTYGAGTTLAVSMLFEQVFFVRLP